MHPGLLAEHRQVHTPFVQSLLRMTPQEIETWRAERRRNWPSAANVERCALKAEWGAVALTMHLGSKALEDKTTAAPQPPQQPPARSTEAGPPRAPGRQKRAPNAPSLRRPARRTTFLANVYRQERTTEADILIQCLMHIHERVK